MGLLGSLLPELLPRHLRSCDTCGAGIRSTSCIPELLQLEMPLQHLRCCHFQSASTLTPSIPSADKCPNFSIPSRPRARVQNAMPEIYAAHCRLALCGAVSGSQNLAGQSPNSQTRAGAKERAIGPLRCLACCRSDFLLQLTHQLCIRAVCKFQGQVVATRHPLLTNCSGHGRAAKHLVFRAHPLNFRNTLTTLGVRRAVQDQLTQRPCFELTSRLAVHSIATPSEARQETTQLPTPWVRMLLRLPSLRHGQDRPILLCFPTWGQARRYTIFMESQTGILQFFHRHQCCAHRAIFALLAPWPDPAGNCKHEQVF